MEIVKLYFIHDIIFVYICTYVHPNSELTNQNCTTSRTHLVSLTVLTEKPQTVRHTQTPGEIKRKMSFRLWIETKWNFIACSITTINDAMCLQSRRNPHSVCPADCPILYIRVGYRSLPSFFNFKNKV